MTYKVGNMKSNTKHNKTDKQKKRDRKSEQKYDMGLFLYKGEKKTNKEKPDIREK